MEGDSGGGGEKEGVVREASHGELVGVVVEVE